MKIVFWIRATLILLMAFVFYPCIYIFGFLMATVCFNNPHKKGIECIDKFNGVFE